MISGFDKGHKDRRAGDKSGGQGYAARASLQVAENLIQGKLRLGAVDAVSGVIFLAFGRNAVIEGRDAVESQG